jgi:predicted nucleotidyltransferase/DNA-binding transcriptional ArsR family regulator
MRTKVRRRRRAAQTPASLLFGNYRHRVLTLLLPRPDKTFYVREIARLTDVPAGSLHRELRLLEEGGLLRRVELGNQVRYRANPDSPVYEELAGLIQRLSPDSALSPVRTPSSGRRYPSSPGRDASSGRRNSSSPRRRGPIGAKTVLPPEAVGTTAAVPSSSVSVVLSEYRLRIAEFCRRHGIRRLGVFGAVARGEAPPEAPVDVLAEFAAEPSGERQAALREELGLLLGRDVRLAPRDALADPAAARSLLAELKVLHSER